tara:strand:- start:20310 stop:21728 length:1419 start_codon:yes stop_codon:yes gene_type:complete
MISRKILLLLLTLPVILGLIIGYQITNDEGKGQEELIVDSCNLRTENSNNYIKEYLIPTKCSAPVAITIDKEGIIWFIENNNSKLVSFNPDENSFIGYQISEHYVNVQSWSIIAVNNEIWFTDHQNNLVWKYTKSENKFEYYKLLTENSYPVQILNNKNQMIVSEIFGKKIAILEIDQLVTNTTNGINEISPEIDLDVLGGIAIDDDGRIWYTMLTWPIEGHLGSYKDGKFTSYKLPEEISSPVGISIRENQIWINDHGSSQFLLFNLDNNTFTNYVTSSSKSEFTTTLPYWNKFDNNGNIWMNVHQSNTIAKMDVERGILIEYEIPTRNFDWGGISNPLQFDIDGQGNIWFTEWTENKIAILNANKPLGFDIEVSTREISIDNNEMEEIILTIDPKKELNAEIKMTGTFNKNGVISNISITFDQIEKELNVKKEVPILIKPDNLSSGVYTIMISVESEEITQSIPIKLIMK